MRTFFIVFLPWIGLFALCALVGSALLLAAWRSTNYFVVQRLIREKQQRDLVEQVRDLTVYKGQAGEVFTEILTTNWYKQPDGTYSFTMSGQAAQTMILLEQAAPTFSPH